MTMKCFIDAQHQHAVPREPGSRHCARKIIVGAVAMHLSMINLTLILQGSCGGTSIRTNYTCHCCGQLDNMP